MPCPHCGPGRCATPSRPLEPSPAPKESGGVGAASEQVDRTSPNARRWKGPALDNVGDVAALCGMMALELPPADLLRIGLHGVKGFCFFRADGVASVGAAVRERFPDVGPVHSASVSVVEAAELDAPLSATPEIEPTGAADVLAQAPHDAARDWAALSDGLAGVDGTYPAGFATESRAFGPPATPTLAEVQADRDYERQRANEALSQLHDANELLKVTRDDLRSVEEENRDACYLLQLLGIQVGTLPDMIAALLPKSRLMKLRIRNETAAALRIDNLSLQEVPETDPRMVEAIRLHREATALRRAAEPVRDHVADAGKKVNG